MPTSWIVAAWLAIVFSLPRVIHAGPPETFAQGLTRHHIALTKAALLEALQNSNAEVRGLAASQLAETKQKDCLPQILQAARDETDVRTKVSLASAAGNLGSTEGDALLESICKDSSVAGWTRTDAARNLFNDHDRACMPELWQLMEPGVDADTRVQAITLVAQRGDLTAEELDRILRATMTAMSDSNVQLRFYATAMLQRLKDARAIPALRTAIQVEKDATIRSMMESALKALLAIQAGPGAS